MEGNAMTGIWLLATEEGGFGLNVDILETNLFNLVIIIGVLIYFGRKFLGSTLGTRLARIEESIQDAERRKKEAASALAEQQQKLAQAQGEARRILEAAEQNAARAREEILAQAKVDVEKMQAAAAQDFSSQQTRILRELRQRVVEMAMEKAEDDLPDRLTESLQHELIDRSISLLGG
jgi:F-type H+-transporting ATPase subunit b